jgi:hypothetical protein
MKQPPFSFRLPIIKFPGIGIFIWEIQFAKAMFLSLTPLSKIDAIFIQFERW